MPQISELSRSTINFFCIRFTACLNFLSNLVNTNLEAGNQRLIALLQILPTKLLPNLENFCNRSIPPHPQLEFSENDIQRVLHGWFSLLLRCALSARANKRDCGMHGPRKAHLWVVVLTHFLQSSSRSLALRCCAVVTQGPHVCQDFL